MDDVKSSQELVLNIQGAVQVATYCPLEAKDSGLIDVCTDCIAVILSREQRRANGGKVCLSQHRYVTSS